MPTGLKMAAVICLPGPTEEVVGSSRRRLLKRWFISPKATPPKLVVMRSLREGWCDSMKNSHIRLPPTVKGTACQNENPLDLAELK